MPRDLLLYDSDCGFCTTVARRLPVLRLDLDIASLRDVDLAVLGVEPERAEREMPYVTVDGVVLYGHLAWARALSRGALPLRALGLLLRTRPLEPLARRVYAWVAGHREQLPGGTPQCAVTPPRP